MPIKLDSASDGRPSVTTFREGDDYTVEAGKLVWTAQHLIRRGWCCNHGCRECPWRTHAPTQQKSEGVQNENVPHDDRPS